MHNNERKLGSNQCLKVTLSDLSGAPPEIYQLTYPTTILADLMWDRTCYRMQTKVQKRYNSCFEKLTFLGDGIVFGYINFYGFIKWYINDGFRLILTVLPFNCPLRLIFRTNRCNKNYPYSKQLIELVKSIKKAHEIRRNRVLTSKKIILFKFFLIFF